MAKLGELSRMGNSLCHHPQDSGSGQVAKSCNGHQHLRLPLLIHPVDLPADKHPDFALCPPLFAPQEVGNEQRETWPENTGWEMQQ